MKKIRVWTAVFTILVVGFLGNNTHAFSEQRKFIGQEYDQDTGLNYLNARYYDPTIGRFISQDSMFWALPNELLADPQQLNSYSYARNNPIVGSDPSGLLTAYFPGTWISQDGVKSESYSSFLDSVKSTFQDLNSGDNFWMPSQTLQDNGKSRNSVANEFIDYLSNYKFAESETLNLVGHSHGGNVANLVSQMSDRKIDNLVTLGTPVRSDYQPNYDKIGNHINAYSSFDAVQMFLGGEGGYDDGWGISLNKIANYFAEFGPAGRRYKNAENVNVTWQSGKNPVSAHTNMPNTSVWSKIDQKIKK